MKPTRAQKAMSSKPSQRQLRAAFDAQRPVDMPVREMVHQKRRKIDGLDHLDGLGGTDGVQAVQHRDDLP